MDVLVLMSVPPGRGGQQFDKQVLSKIKVLHAFLTKHHLPVEIQVDGGIKLEEALLCATAGATVVVMGTFLFQNTLLPQTVLQRLKKRHE